MSRATAHHYQCCSGCALVDATIPVVAVVPVIYSNYNVPTNEGEHRLRTRGAYYYYFLTAPRSPRIGGGGGGGTYFRGKVP